MTRSGGRFWFKLLFAIEFDEGKLLLDELVPKAAREGGRRGFESKLGRRFKCDTAKGSKRYVNVSQSKTLFSFFSFYFKFNIKHKLLLTNSTSNQIHRLPSSYLFLLLFPLPAAIHPLYLSMWKLTLSYKISSFDSIQSFCISRLKPRANTR